MSVSLPTLPTNSSSPTPSVATPSPSPTPSSTPTPTSTSTPVTTPTSTATTSTPATTSASTPSQTTSSSSSSSATSSSSSSSSTITDTTPSTSTTATPTPVTLTSTSGGNVITVTTAATPVSSSSTPSSGNAVTTTSKSFFQNTGAVAGVFSVVGVVVLVIFVVLVTNAVRRRRARKFDRDVAEAAAEAAATSRSPFDDFPSGGKGGNGGYPYSDSTHGTFGQAPMGIPSDPYGMNEMSNYDPYAAGAASLAAAATVGRARSRQESESRTPGIAGVGAGNLAREPSRRAPYHAFAGPPPQTHQTMDHTASMRYRRGADVLEAAGLAGAGVAAMADPSGGAYINRRPSQFTQQTHGSMRSQGRSSNENFPPPLHPGYQPPPRNDNQFADAYTGINTTPPLTGAAFSNPHDVAPPFPSNSQNHLLEEADFHEGAPPLHNEDDRMSYADDDDYGQHNRVLRVANE